jgi:hypothetical protein
MVVPLTPKPTHKVETLDFVSRTTTTIGSCREEVVVLRNWVLTRYCFTSSILETKQKSEEPQWKSWTHTSTQISTRNPPHPNHPPTHHTNTMVEHVTQRRRPTHRHPRRHGNDFPCPRQVTTDHCLTSWRRRGTEEVVIPTVLFREIHSWN